MIDTVGQRAMQTISGIDTLAGLLMHCEAGVQTATHTVEGIVTSLGLPHLGETINALQRALKEMETARKAIGVAKERAIKDIQDIARSELWKAAQDTQS